MIIPKFKNEPYNFKHKNNKRKQHKSDTNYIGMGPLDGYDRIANEELRSLKRLTRKEARIQTEILLRATKWMK